MSNLKGIEISHGRELSIYIVSKTPFVPRENLIHYRVFLKRFEVNEPLEKDVADTFYGARQPQGIVFASSLLAINPFDAITNFRGQNALSRF